MPWLEELLGPEYKKILGGFVLGLIGTILGVAIKAATDWLSIQHQKKWKHPRLTLSFDERIDCQTFFREIESGTLEPNKQIRFMYVRCSVTNTNPEIAKDVRAYLTKVENITSPAGVDQPVYSDTQYNDSLPLIWSNEPSNAAVVLPKGVVRHFDLLFVTEGDKGFRMQLRDPSGKELKPEAYATIFTKSQALRFTVLVAGENCDPAIMSITIRWNGTWPPVFAP